MFYLPMIFWQVWITHMCMQCNVNMTYNVNVTYTCMDRHVFFLKLVGETRAQSASPSKRRGP